MPAAERRPARARPAGPRGPAARPAPAPAARPRGILEGGPLPEGDGGPGAVRFPLRPVRPSARVTRAGPYGLTADRSTVAIDLLACGHRRFEDAGAWRPAAARRCRPCPASGTRPGR